MERLNRRKREMNAHTRALSHEEVKQMIEELEKAKQLTELQKLIKQYIRIVKKVGLSTNPEEAITQIRNFIKFLKEWQETKRVCGVV